MKPARIVLLAVALLAGGLAAFLATRGGTPETVVTTQVQVEQEQRAQILVASQPIGVGERLNDKVITWQEWPVGALQAAYVTQSATPDAIEQLSGSIARFEIFAGEPIRQEKLASTKQGYLSAVIQPGMRGVSVDVTASSGAGGFIVPNDRVDVVLTQNTESGRVSETILANVKVLALGARLGELGATGGVENGDTDPKAKMFGKDSIATLELDPGQSEAIINASKIGSLSLILRSVADFSETAETAQSRNNSAISVIRFGKSSSVMKSGDGGGDTPPVTNASVPAEDAYPVQAPSSATGADDLPDSPAPSLPPQQ